MPIISGGGGTFNGGAITGSLTIDDPTGTFLELDDSTGDDAKVFIVGNTALGGVADVELSGATSTLSLADSTGAGPALSTGGGLTVLNALGSPLAQVNAAGYIISSVHAAPADGVLNAGDCALWFDQTNGAAKLMVKAKQADGTVKTAAIALS